MAAWPSDSVRTSACARSPSTRTLSSRIRGRRTSLAVDRSNATQFRPPARARGTGEELVAEDVEATQPGGTLEPRHRVRHLLPGTGDRVGVVARAADPP